MSRSWLPVGERRVELARLRVDEVSGEAAGIAPEEGVRERRVAPEEPGHVQADEQLGARVEHAFAQVAHGPALEQRPERQRVVEVTRDQDGLELRAPHDADHLHDRDTLVGEPPQQVPLALGQPLGQLLERIQLPVVVDEADDVPADAADEGDDPLRLPLRELLVPREVEEARMPRACVQLEARGRHQRRAIVAPSNAATPPGLRTTVFERSCARAK